MLKVAGVEALGEVVDLVDQLVEALLATHRCFTSCLMRAGNSTEARV